MHSDGRQPEFAGNSHSPHLRSGPGAECWYRGYFRTAGDDLGLPRQPSCRGLQLRPLQRHASTPGRRRFACRLRASPTPPAWLPLPRKTRSSLGSSHPHSPFSLVVARKGSTTDGSPEYFPQWFSVSRHVRVARQLHHLLSLDIGANACDPCQDAVRVRRCVSDNCNLPHSAVAALRRPRCSQPLAITRST